MSRGPRRLKDDPDFQWETGCNLDDESVLTGGYDLARMRAAVLSSAPVVGDGVPSIRPRRAWRWRMGGVVGLTTTIAAFWLGTQFASEGPDEPAAPVGVPFTEGPPIVAPLDEGTEREGPAKVEIPAVEEPADGVETPERRPTPASEPPRAGAPTAARAPSVPVDEADDGVAEAPAPDPVPSEAEERGGEAPAPLPAPAPVSRLAQEMAVYEPAANALEEGDSTAAATGFRTYLDRFPEGTLRPEAELGLLWALHDTGDAARTERWAATLQDRPAHREHRDDIRELRAQALVRLGRCEAALESLDGLPARVVGPIRRACRSR